MMQGGKSDFIYLIAQGKCKVLLRTKGTSWATSLPPKCGDSFILSRLRRGEYFGEHSSINGEANPYTIQVESESVTVLMIDHASLAMLGRDTIDYLRGQIRMKTNWVRFKTQRFADHTPEEIAKFEFANEVSV